MLGRFDPLLDDEDQHSEAEIDSEVKKSEVPNDKADPTGAESIDGKPAVAENKENVKTTRENEKVDSAPIMTPRTSNETTMTKGTNETTSDTHKKKTYREALLG